MVMTTTPIGHRPTADMAPLSRAMHLAGQGVFAIAYGLVRAIFLFVVCAFVFFDLSMPDAKYFPAFVVLVVASVSFIGIGMMMSVLPLISPEKGTQLGFVAQGTLLVVSGVYYPVEVLPQWMQWIAVISPATYALDGIREAILEGQGMSLFKGARNQFFDRSDQYHLSPVAKGFIAGLLVHAREISGVLAQWVNSYKRLVPGYEAPVYVGWSQRNRSALVRIPLYKPGSEQATRAEIRCPDPACNPYLAFAALLQAGLEGIEKGYKLPDPMERNLYRLTADERREQGIVSLPESLGEAIDELAGSDLMQRTLGEHIFPRYVELKRREWDEYRVQVTEWEKEKYLAAL